MPRLTSAKRARRLNKKDFKIELESHVAREVGAIIYLGLAVILGLLLSLLVHVFIERIYLSLAQSWGISVNWYGGCALPPVVQAALWLMGASGGFFLGRVWWRYLYVDRIWERKSEL